MLRTISCALILFASIHSSAFAALTLKTERNAVCGVELYEERFDGDVCGWVYFEKQSSACELDYYKFGEDLSCPGSDAGGRRITAQMNGFGPLNISWATSQGGSTLQGGEDIRSLIGSSIPNENFTRETRFWSCKVGGVRPQGSFIGAITCTAKPFAASCQNPKFGSVYKSCRHSSHGNESPKKCRSDKFSPELYKSCSFYKTPEEIDAYIEATYSSLALNSTLLPARQADLYSSFRQEASFICLVEKYKDLDGFDVVYDDLVQKFKTAFTYDWTQSPLTCADATNENASLRITAGTLDCANFTLDTLKTLTKPETMNNLVFNRFKSTCTTKLSYDLLAGWFDAKSTEIGQLIEDVVAKQDANRKAQLQELKSSVTSSK